MFRRNPEKFGKLKYAYGRPSTLDMGSRRHKRKLIFKNINPEKSRKIKIWLIFGLLLIGLCYLTYLLFFSPYFTFTKTKVVQEGMESKETIFNTYFKELKGKNLVLVDTDEIIEEIVKDHPEFANISIKKIYPHEIQIEASKYPAAANVINVSGESQITHIVNLVGLSIQSNIENPNLPYVKIRSEKPLDTKSPLLSKENLEYIIGATNYFEDKLGMKVFEAEYLKEEREVHLKTEKYFYLWMDIQKPFAEQIDKLKIVVPKLDIYNMPLEYIDLRISEISGEKIIYKKR